MTTHERHLTRAGLEKYLDASAPAIVRLDGDPTGYIAIDPHSNCVSLRFPSDGTGMPDVVGYKHFTSGSVSWNSSTWFELGLAPGTDAVEAFPILCAAADRVQLQGMAFDQAAADALKSYKELLAVGGRLSDEAEIGLFGELLVFGCFTRQFGEEAALSAWQGPAKEEHDFGLVSTDVEVKTTTAEKRVHWINDLDQLQPSLGRPLWLVSVQLTGGGADGRTLPELIARVRSMLTDHGIARFAAGLGAGEWSDERADLYRRRFRLRSAPVAFRVDGDFPALTTASLAAAGFDLAHFQKVRYALDLSGLATSTPPFGLDEIQEGLDQ